MKQKIMGAAIVLFWVAMMFTLVRDRLDFSRGKGEVSELSPIALASRWQDQEEWMQLLYKGIEVGAMNITMKKRDKGPGYLLTSRLLFQIRFLSWSKSVVMNASAVLDELFILQKFLVQFRVADISSEVKGFYQKERLFFRVQRGGEASVGTLDLEHPPSLLDAVKTTVGRELPLEVGRTFTIPAYDPVWGSGQGTAEISIVSRETIILDESQYQAFRVETTLGDFTTVAWMDEEGSTLLRQVTPDLTMKRSSRSEILASYPIFRNPVPLPGPIEVKDFRVPGTGKTREPGGLLDILQDVM